MEDTRQCGVCRQYAPLEQLLRVEPTNGALPWFVHRSQAYSRCFSAIPPRHAAVIREAAPVAEAS